LLPHESFYDDVVQILNNQGGGRVNENFLLAVPQSFLDEGRKKKKTNCFDRKTFKSKASCIQDQKGLGKKRAGAYVASVERKRGHIAEASTEELTSTEIKRDDENDQLTQFRIDLGVILGDIVKDLGLKEMGPEGRDLKLEFIDSTIATFASLFGMSVGMAEASSMAGGDVEGGGPAWLSKQDDKTLIGEEDDE
jgi:hypothetical protein